MVNPAVSAGSIALSLWLAFGVEGAASEYQCPTTPVEPCAVHHGRLSFHNGIAQTIWMIGTHREVAVRDLNPDAESVFEKYEDMTSLEHSNIYGDFDICPIAPDVPGAMRDVCVKSASRLVVENTNKIVPPFRLLSTWPAAVARSAIREGQGWCAARRDYEPLLYSAYDVGTPTTPEWQQRRQQWGLSKEADDIRVVQDEATCHRAATAYWTILRKSAPDLFGKHEDARVLVVRVGTLYLVDDLRPREGPGANWDWMIFDEHFKKLAAFGPQ